MDTDDFIPDTEPFSSRKTCQGRRRKRRVAVKSAVHTRKEANCTLVSHEQLIYLAVTSWACGGRKR